MPYTEQGSMLEIGPSGPSTMMACPESTMAQATAFTTAMQSARSFGSSEGTLKLLDADGAVVATLTAQSSSLAGTSWYVTMINNGRQALVGIVSGSTVTIAFDTQGRVSGSAGCNRYTAAYTADGDSLRFSNMATTRMACGDPALDEQEQQFRRALEAVATLHFESDRLDLRRADGELAMILLRSP
jgi:heat shock protein HslJ